MVYRLVGAKSVGRRGKRCKMNEVCPGKLINTTQCLKEADTKLTHSNTVICLGVSEKLFRRIDI